MARSIGTYRTPRLDKLYFALFCMLICCLPLSYQPLIHLGEQTGANIDISLIYPVMAVLAVVSLPQLWQQRKILISAPYNQLLLAFAGWNLLAIAWSDNPLRGTLVAGLVCLATIVFLSIQAHKAILIKYKDTLLGCLTATTIFLCLVCLWQLFGDALHVPNTFTLLPSTYQSQVFGYARVTGFAAEPQFLGSLLLIPFSIFLYRTLSQRNMPSLWLFGLTTTTITLTVSRGALIAMFVAFILTLLLAFKQTSLRCLAVVCGTTFAAIALGIGLLTYTAEINTADRVSGQDALVKTVGQLSLGIIDISPLFSSADHATTHPLQHTTNSQVATQVGSQNAPGYVPESTDSRLSMSREALALLKDSPAHLLYGIGVGSFGVTLHNKYSAQSVASIVNNHYVETLTELGMIGIGLFIGFFGFVYRALILRQAWGYIPAVSALLVQWLFFSGYPNVLHLWPLLGLALVLPVRSKSITRPVGRQLPQR